MSITGCRSGPWRVGIAINDTSRGDLAGERHRPGMLELDALWRQAMVHTPH